MRPLESCGECGGEMLASVPIGNWTGTPVCDCRQNEDGSWTVGTRLVE